MKAKIIKKKTGYFVGSGKLTKLEQAKIKKIIKQDGTYQITGIVGYVGFWTDKSKVYIEKSVWFKDFVMAYKLGKSKKQKAIWDCQNKRNIWLVEQKGKKIILHVNYQIFKYWIYEE